LLRAGDRLRDFVGIQQAVISPSCSSGSWARSDSSWRSLSYSSTGTLPFRHIDDRELPPHPAQAGKLMTVVASRYLIVPSGSTIHESAAKSLLWRNDSGLLCPVSIVRVNALPHIFPAWKALQRIDTESGNSRPTSEITVRCGVVTQLPVKQPSLGPARPSSAALLLCAHECCHISAGAAISWNSPFGQTLAYR
jgi:hypothetical protein